MPLVLEVLTRVGLNRVFEEGAKEEVGRWYVLQMVIGATLRAAYIPGAVGEDSVQAFEAAGVCARQDGALEQQKRADVAACLVQDRVSALVFLGMIFMICSRIVLLLFGCCCRRRSFPAC